MEWQRQVNGTLTLWHRDQVIGQVAHSVSHGGSVHLWMAYARHGNEWVRAGDFGEAEDATAAVEDVLVADLDASVAEQ